MSAVVTAMSDSWVLTGRALARWRREPMRVIAGVLFSFMFMLMFGFLFGGAMRTPGGDYVDFVVPGILGMTMMFGLEATMLSVIQDKDAGIFDRFRSMPMSSVAVVGGRAGADLIESLVNLVALVGCGLLIGWRFDVSPGAFLAAMALLLALRFAMIWVGVFLGMAITSPDSTALVQILVFPIAFLSSVFVPTETLAPVLRVLAEWNPLSATVVAVRDLLGSPTAGGSWATDNALTLAVVWPVVITVVFGLLSTHRYRNLSR